MRDLLSLVLQTTGIITILGSQVWFWLRVRKEWGSLKKAFLSLATPQFGIGKERLKKMSQAEVKETFRKFRLARFLYEDFMISIVGLFITLLGTLLLFV